MANRLTRLTEQEAEMIIATRKEIYRQNLAERKEIMAKRGRGRVLTSEEMKKLYPMRNVKVTIKKKSPKVVVSKLAIKRHIKISGKADFEYKEEKPYIEGELNSIDAKKEKEVKKDAG